MGPEKNIGIQPKEKLNPEKSRNKVEEILSAFKGEGSAIKKRDDTHQHPHPCDLCGNAIHS